MLRSFFDQFGHDVEMRTIGDYFALIGVSERSMLRQFARTPRWPARNQCRRRSMHRRCSAPTMTSSNRTRSSALRGLPTSADATLNKYFAQAHGIRQSTAKVVRHAPSIGADGRLFVSGVGADKAPRLVVPSERVPALISATHERLDHRSADAVRIELQKAFWWPRMHKQIDEWCARCPICATRLRAQRPTPELASFPRAARFAAIHIDVMPMPLSAAGNTCALMIVDRTTGAARAVPMKTKSTADIVKAYQREWVDVFGPAESLHPDDALEFNSKELRSMCRRHGTRLIDVAPYNKQANGLVERFIQTVTGAARAPA
jgi:hypothetical protein